MPYVKTKRVPGKDGKVYTYHQLVEGYREGGKVKQKVIAHLGRYPTPEEAASVWEKQAKYRREREKNLVYAAPLMRAGKVHRLYYGRGKWFLPKHDTP